MSDYAERLQRAVGARYTIVGEVGRGGMATVLRAHDTRYGRDVAIKLLRPELTAAMGVERFLREIRIAAKLSHPHILPLFESDDADGLLYYTMPFVEGESLRDRLEREGQLPLDDALQILREVGGALSHAHAMGIVHRDIKPENVLLAGGHAVVTDFGIARAVHEAGGDRLTETGLAIGTPHYMSPEQASASPHVDARTDEYALACVLYEMLAGDPPFTGSNAMAVLARHTMDPVPSVRTARSTISPALEAAVHRGLAKTPADRFPTIQQFVDAAEDRRASTETARATPSTRSAGKSLTRRVGVAGVVAALALGGWWIAQNRPDGGAPPGPSLVAVLPFDVVGPSDLEWLENDLPELLGLEFTGEGGPRAIDRHAVQSEWNRTAGAGDPAERYRRLQRALDTDRVLAGRVIAEPTGLHAVAALLDAASADTLAVSEARGSAESFVILAESLAVGLLVRQAGEGSRLKGVLSSSPTAVRSWLAGLALFRVGNYEGAVERYRDAVNTDSTFALAAAGMMWAAAWLEGINDTYLRGRRLAWAHRDRLPPADSTILVAESNRNGYPEPLGEQHNFRQYTHIVQAYPDRWDAWSRYGDYLWHEGGFFVEDGIALAVDAFQRAVSLDSAGALEPWEHLAQYYAGHGDTAAFAGVPEHLQRNPGLHWLAALAGADARWRDSTRALHPDQPTGLLAYWMWVLQFTGRSLSEAQAIASVLMDRAERGDDDARIAVWRYALNAGRPQRAGRFVNLDDPFEQRAAVWAAIHWAGDSATTATAAARIRARLDSTVTDEASARSRSRDACHLGLFRLAGGDTTWTDTATALMREVRPDEWYAEVCEVVLRAVHATRTDAPDVARSLHVADSILLEGGNYPLYHVGFNMALASAYERAGQLRDARRRIRLWGGFEPDFALPRRLIMEGRLAAALGRRDEALRAYGHYLALMSDAEPSFAAEVERVRAALAGAIETPRTND